MRALALGAVLVVAGGALAFATLFSPREGTVVPLALETYRNEPYHFEVTPLPGMTVTEYSGPESSLTVEFVATSSERFRVFVIPYGNPVISERRFAIDLPSGVREELTNIVVDEVPAIMFFSRDSEGDTREVWALHHGFLYEITTRKEHDLWLAEVMKTWEFL